MALGDDLISRYLQPPQAPVQQQPMPFTGGGGGFLDNPMVQMFLLQSGANLLGGQGFGPALAGGASGVGRYAALEGQRVQQEKSDARKREVEDRDFALRLAEFQRRGAGGSGGSGGGSSKGYDTTDPNKMTDILYNQALEEWKAATKNALPGEETPPMPDKLDYIVKGRTVSQAVNNGMPLEMYTGMRGSKGQAAADQLANIFATNPDEGHSILQEAQRFGDTANAPNVGEPGALQAPAPTAAPVVPKIYSPGGGSTAGKTPPSKPEEKPSKKKSAITRPEPGWMKDKLGFGG